MQRVGGVLKLCYCHAIYREGIMLGPKQYQAYLAALRAVAVLGYHRGIARYTAAQRACIFS